MGIVVSEAGKAFDPVIVDIIHRRYRELEELAVRTGGEKSKQLSTEIRIERGLAPATGFAESAENEKVLTLPGQVEMPTLDPLSSIAAATQKRRCFMN